MTDPRVFTLRGTLEDPSEARHFLGAQLDGVSGTISRDVRDDALLVVSELVSNVVQHGTLPAHVVVSTQPTGLRVEVFDSAVALPIIPEPSAPPSATDQTSGRGLLIVAAMTTACGAVSTADPLGKVVWFEMHYGV